jgi:glutamate N-acetyltransferase/amino-acid N-acetyltransferase
VTVIVPGFRFAAVAAGIRKTGAPDLALAVCDRPTVAAGTFTQNAVRAAPVVLSERRLRAGRAQALVVNAGCANACTGDEGMRDARAMASAAALAAGVPEERVLVCSTGVIGVRLPVPRIAEAMPQAARALSPEGLGRFAQAILTTDTFPKLRATQGVIGKKRVVVAGVAKGAGMIAPRMATLLAFLFTNAAVEQGFLRRAWREVVEETFNAVTVDGDTSTNDTALLLASGEALNAPLGAGSREAKGFRAMLREVAGGLAEDIAQDGEGATRLIEVLVEGARSAEEARRVARRIAESPLVKTALYGGDPNWGRILCAVGNAARVSADTVDLYVGEVRLARRGREVEGAEPRAREVMRQKRYPIRVVLGRGRARARMLTCDLTEKYVEINAHYRS